MLVVALRQKRFAAQRERVRPVLRPVRTGETFGKQPQGKRILQQFSEPPLDCSIQNSLGFVAVKPLLQDLLDFFHPNGSSRKIGTSSPSVNALRAFRSFDPSH